MKLLPIIRILKPKKFVNVKCKFCVCFTEKWTKKKNTRSKGNF